MHGTIRQAVQLTAGNLQHGQVFLIRHRHNVAHTVIDLNTAHHVQVFRRDIGAKRLQNRVAASNKFIAHAFAAQTGLELTVRAGSRTALRCALHLIRLVVNAVLSLRGGTLTFQRTPTVAASALRRTLFLCGSAGARTCLSHICIL